MLWNIPIVTSPSIPNGSALLVDVEKVAVLDREMPTIYVSRDHLDYRTRNLVLILVEMRLGLAIYDTNAVRRIDLSIAT